MVNNSDMIPRTDSTHGKNKINRAFANGTGKQRENLIGYCTHIGCSLFQKADDGIDKHVYRFWTFVLGSSRWPT